MVKKIDCRKKENRSSLKCKINRFCNKRENNLASTGKGMISLALPATGVAITAYETGKSLVKLGVCKR